MFQYISAGCVIFFFYWELNLLYVFIHISHIHKYYIYTHKIQYLNLLQKDLVINFWSTFSTLASSAYKISHPRVLFSSLIHYYYVAICYLHHNFQHYPTKCKMQLLWMQYSGLLWVFYSLNSMFNLIDSK